MATPKLSQTDKAKLSLAGEYSVAAELCKRNFFASVTYGNAKATDVLIFDYSCYNRKYKTIEVKTTRGTRFVTSFFNKYYDKNAPHPDYWVLVQIDKNDIFHYYILTHDEMGKVQMDRNGSTTWPTTKSHGVDNVLLSHVVDFEEKWDKVEL